MMIWCMLVFYPITPINAQTPLDTEHTEGVANLVEIESDTAVALMDTTPYLLPKIVKLKVLPPPKQDSIGLLEDTLLAPIPDSIVMPMLSDSVQNQHSIITYNSEEEPSSNFDIQPLREKSNQSVIFYALLLCVALWAFVKYAFGNYFSYIYESFNNFNIANKVFQEQDFKRNTPGILMSINVGLTLGILTFLLLRYFNKLPDISHEWLLLGIIVFVSLYLLIRQFLWNMASFILPVREVIQFYLYNQKVVFVMLSICLLPLLMLVAFSYTNLAQIAVYFSLVLILIFISYLAYRGIIISKKIITFHKFHFIVYLCTLEIAPLLVVYKMVQRFIV